MPAGGLTRHQPRRARYPQTPDRRRRAAPISRVYWLDGLAFLRFAQYAFIRLEMASLSDALHVTFRFCVVLGFAAEPLAAALFFRRFRLALGLLAVTLAGAFFPCRTAAASCRASMSLWSLEICICLAETAWVISLNSRLLRPLGRVHDERTAE